MEWWEFFLVMLVFMPVLVLWLGCIIDAIGRPDMSGWTKALWVLFILFLPLIGALVYVIMRPAVIVAPRQQSMDGSLGGSPDAVASSTSRADPNSNLAI
jgi:hypothetical protein